MRTLTLLLLATFAMLLGNVAKADIVNTSLWINELHYDNDGTDVGEAVEVVVPTGFVVSALDLELYNGSGGAVYDTINGASWVGGFINLNGFDFYTVSPNSIQNGSPDGIGLSSATQLYQYLSYEGSFAATNGRWNGRTSTDIGVSETSATPIGQSLQLIGTGNNYDAFTWTGPITQTFGAANSGQTLIPEPGTFGVLGLLAGMGFIRRRN